MVNNSRIGVYICRCGGNISDTVDVERVKEATAKFEGVEVAETYDYMCSSKGQEMIQSGVKERQLNRVVVASCSPRMHLETFRGAVSEAGLNPYLLDMVNIREQDSWVHSNKNEATEKAINLIRGAAGRASFLGELNPIKTNVRNNVAIIGGGIAGISAAIEMADQGYQVFLIERSPSIGGRMAKLSKTFPTLDCSSCILAPKMVYVAHHPKIKIITMAEPTALSGYPGNYSLLVKVKPRFVDIIKCTSCGECSKVCPVKVPSDFEEGLGEEKAVHIPFKQAIPNAYVVNPDKCLYLNKGVCRLCERFCKGKAIDFNQKEQTLELDVGAIVISTGYDQIDPQLFGQYAFGLNPNIITNTQFERLMIQGIHRPSDGKPPRRVAFVLCVGSRDTEKGKPYCCKIGCMNAIKEAVLLQKAVTDADPWIFYTDLRANGKGCEEFYATARDHGVRFVRGKVAEIVTAGDGQLLIRAEDTLLGMQIEEPFDMVVLQTALIPNTGTEELAKIMGTPLGSDGFFLERHYKLRPVDSSREGIYICGCAVGPKDIRESVIEAMAAASKATTFVGKGEFYSSPEVAFVLKDRCNSCGECVKVCPANAITISSDGAAVNTISCVGCGICVPSCPREAIELNHCTEEQLIAQIRGMCQGDAQPKIIAFLEKNTAYASADMAGQSRLSYPVNVRIIGVPSVGRVGSKHLLHAFAAGADGVLFIEGSDTVLTEDRLREHVDRLKKELAKHGIQPLRLMSTTTTIPQYDKVVNLFETFSARVAKMGAISSGERQKIAGELQKELVLEVGGAKR